MRLTRSSACKVNLVLNVLGRRPDGYHDLETLFLPAPLYDFIEAETADSGISLICSRADLPADSTNLVYRAAADYLQRLAARTGRVGGARLWLDKRLPLAAGLGGGSANAAATLLILNELYEGGLTGSDLDDLAAGLGSDVNFFLQDGPALAFGRGEKIVRLGPLAAVQGATLLLYHPGFGVPTPWAFRALAGYPERIAGAPGRAAGAAARFAAGDRVAAGNALYNALEAPVWNKYPVLALAAERLREEGAWGALMSGSGSTTFGLFHDRCAAERAAEAFRSEFGAAGWLQIVDLQGANHPSG